MAPPKNSTVVQQMAEVVGSFEEKMVKKFEELNIKLVEQVMAMETLRAKVDMSMNSIGQVQQDQAQLTKVISAKPPPPPPPPPHPCPPLLQVPHREKAGLMGAKPGSVINPTSEPFVSFPPSTTPPVVSVPPSPAFPSTSAFTETSESSSHKPWMPKLDFLRFDGTDVRIWLDKC